MRDDHLLHTHAHPSRRGMPWRSMLLCLVGLLACAGAGAAAGLRSGAGAQPELAGLLVSSSSARALESSITSAADPEQARILASGAVTPSVYLAAKSTAAACVRDQVVARAAAHGFTVSVTVTGPTLSSDGYQADYTYRVDGSPAALASDSVDARGAVDEVCQRQHVEAIEHVYHLQRRADFGLGEGRQRRLRPLHLRASDGWRASTDRRPRLRARPHAGPCRLPSD